MLTRLKLAVDRDIRGSIKWQQELISRLDSRTLRPINVLGLSVFSNNIKNGISDIRDIKRRIMACP